MQFLANGPSAIFTPIGRHLLVEGAGWCAADVPFSERFSQVSLGEEFSFETENVILECTAIYEPRHFFLRAAEAPSTRRDWKRFWFRIGRGARLFG